MDFGIARAVADSQMTMTQTAQVIGTAQYLSPEQARGERVDARSDLYSTGCLLYELLTGRPPFTGDSPVAIAYQHVKEEPVPPSQIDPAVPHWADAIVLKAMRKDPADRYQSAGEMRNDIQRALSGAPLAAPMPAAAFGPGTRRMGAATSQYAGRTTAIPPYQYGPPGYGPDGGGPDGEPPRHRVWPWVAVALAVVVLVAVIVLIKFVGGGGNNNSVPNVVGESLTQAESTLVHNGFKIGRTTPQASATVGKNDVISTNPGAGQSAGKGTAVNIVWSSGAPPTRSVAVPNVIGETQAKATNDLTAKGFKVHTVQGQQAGAAPDSVINQTPNAGTLKPPGSTVTITVTPGAQTVPSDVIGKDQGSAYNELSGPPYNFNVSVQEGPGTSQNQQPGTVYATSPGPGTPLAQGGNIIIFVVAQSSPSPSPTPTDTSSTSPKSG
jgi:serine/threonine-protein kinase